MIGKNRGIGRLLAGLAGAIPAWGDVKPMKRALAIAACGLLLLVHAKQARAGATDGVAASVPIFTQVATLTGPADPTRKVRLVVFLAYPNQANVHIRDGREQSGVADVRTIFDAKRFRGDVRPIAPLLYDGRIRTQERGLTNHQHLREPKSD